MNRRNFSKNFLAAGLAAPALLGPGSALATNDGEEKLARLGLVELRLVSALVVITYLIILNQRGPLGINLGRPMPQFDENRAGILGGLGRPTLETLLLTSVLVGAVRRVNSLLYVTPAGPDIAPSKVLLTHRDRSWEPPGRLTKAALTQIPQLSKIPVIGHAFRTTHKDRSSLLILIRPSIVNVPEG
jgi:hypothetical protein